MDRKAFFEGLASMQSRRREGLRIFIAAALCTCSTPLLADQLILRCDSPKDGLSFSVLLDLSKRIVLDIGFGTKIDTEQFSETVIAASDRDSAVKQSLIIDRITGQFQLTWPPSNTGDKGGNYQGTCALGRRLF
jgi:hypothetical protein